MKTWSSALALIAAGTMLVGSAFAQATAPSGDQKDKPQSDSMKSSDMKSDAAKGDKSAAKSGRGSRMAARGGNAEQVRAVQQALKDKGHDPGEIDGKMGPKTQAALRDYQSKESLKATGRLDAETMAKLGIEAKTGAADTGSSASPSASPKSGAPGASSGDKK